MLLRQCDNDVASTMTGSFRGRARVRARARRARAERTGPVGSGMSQLLEASANDAACAHSMSVADACR